MKWNGNDHISITVFQKFPAAARHQTPKWFSKRYFSTVLESVHGLAQRMFLGFCMRITSPRPRLHEVGRARQANTAGMVVTTRVGKRPAAEVAHRMTDELNPAPTIGAKIF